MKLIRLSIYISVSIFLFGCNFINYQKDSIETKKAVSFSYDKFKNSWWATGPSIRGENGDLHLRSYGTGKNPSILAHQLYVQTWETDNWFFFKKAYNDEGNILDVTLIDTEVGSCSSYGCLLHEHLAINLTTDELIKLKDKGLSFKLYGKYKNGKQHYLSGDYIRGYLNAIYK